MNLGSISDQLPTYPNNIQGELRLILQTKDVFLVCYKHLEEYRKLVNEQNRLITKEFVQEQLQIGEDEISELKMELQDAETRLNARLRHNELLADHLASLGYASLESGASVRHLALCRSPQMRKNMLAQRQGGGLGNSRLSEPRPPTHMIDNIALAIAEIHQEVRSKVKPLLDYYRDLFYLQLHFSLVLGQVCNYCMPLVTENIGLIDRIFFWSERPEFDLVRRAGDIGDRLKEIYTRAQTVLGVLAESVRFLQSKVELQKTLEQRFHERLDEQQKTKDKILREVHTTKQNMDMLEEENDRLVGSLVKVDPSFVDSRHFYELAEGGNLVGAKKPNTPKETAQHNAEEEMDEGNAAGGRRRDSTEFNRETNGMTNRNGRRIRDLMTPSCLENATEEVNNNKATSLASEITPRLTESKSNSKQKLKQEEMDELLKDLKTKIATVKTRAKEPSGIYNKHNVENSETVSSVGDSNETQGTSRVPSRISNSRSKSATNGRGSRNRSKSRQRENNCPTSSAGTAKAKVQRRATSVERHTASPAIRRRRPKSSLGGPRTQGADVALEEITRHPKKKTGKRENDLYSSSLSTPAGDNADSPTMSPTSLKTKLLGRTRDIFEAAFHRASKTSSVEHVSRMEGSVETSQAAGRISSEDPNNDGVTSVSSFASLLVADSSLGEPRFTEPAAIIPPRHRRSLEPKKLKRSSEQPRTTKKGTLHIRGRSNPKYIEEKPLPALSTETLLIERSSDLKVSS
ncbi:unnamed protein product [Dicrocoelium dendriticum]|nr:unnamed protein product [Dicrocoelium dendriticum]